MSNLVVSEARSDEGEEGGINDYLIFQLGHQNFCIHVEQIRDVLRLQTLTHVPLSKPAVSGVMNLRGHIVTAVDARVALDIDVNPENDDMSIVVEFEEELYSVIVDAVHDVITFEPEEMDRNPSILEGRVREISNGVVKRDDQLIICLDVARLFETVNPSLEEEES